MYIPTVNQFTNNDEVISFMRTFNFANLISNINNKPYATPLPFLIDQEENEEIILVSHCAKENMHWKYIEDQTNLVIFQEPHAFISTELYVRDSVPTWNYMTVHAYGSAKIYNDRETCKAIINRTISQFQGSFHADWGTYSDTKVNKLLNGIVCFQININTLEAKAKLSQNKTLQERKNIYTHLLNQSNSTENIIGEEMLKREKIQE